MRNWILLLLILLGSIPVQAQDGQLLSQRYHPGFKKGSIKSYLDDIQEQTHISISFSVSSVNGNKQVTLDDREYTLEEALRVLLAGQELVFVERRHKILIIPVSEAKRYIRYTNSTVHGYVKDKSSGEVLIGATVYIPSLKIGVTTNNYGYYSLSATPGRYDMVCTYIGYQPDTIDLKINTDIRRDIELKTVTQLTEVNITSEKKLIPGHSHLTFEDIDSKPMLLGETDVMRALQNEPGVQMGMEGSNSIHVRGGEPGQNLHLLDGVPLYYTNHFGFTSIFNADAIKSVDFHKGAFPARFGGRASSIIEVNTRDGDMQRWRGNFNIGIVKGSFNIEGPIIKDKASIMVSGRRTWIDALWRPFTSDFKFDFHDLNVKANYILNEKNRLYLSFYTGRDQFGVDDSYSSYNNRSGNTILSAKWNTIVNPKLFINTLLTFSRYRLNGKGTSNMFFQDTVLENYTYKLGSYISDVAGSLQAHWYPNSQHHVEAGGRMARSSFIPTLTETISSVNETTTGLESQFSSNELTLYAEDNIKLNEHWVIRPGLHWSSWFNKDFGYSSMQPRFYIAYSPVPTHTIHASFTQMTQFLHNIDNGGFTSNLLFTNGSTPNWNTETYAPSTERVLPEESLMGSVGYTAKPVSHMEMGLDFYYKDMVNVPMMDTRKYVYDNSISWEEKIIQGKGWSYGMEVFLKEHIGMFRFSAAYTLSWSWRRFKELNEGMAFPFRYDRRHSISMATVYKPNKHFDASANWRFASGEAITLPDYLFPDFDNGFIGNSLPYFGQVYNYSYSSVNNYRLPPIHRLDVGFNFHKQKGKRVLRTWSLGMFNVYGRTNIMYVTLQSYDNGVKLIGTGFLKFIPFVSYKLSF